MDLFSFFLFFFFIAFSRVVLNQKHITFVVKKKKWCRRRNNINVRCIMSSTQDLWIWKEASCCVEMVLTVASPPILLNGVSSGHRLSSVPFPIRLAVGCLWGAQCLYLCQNLYFLLKNKRKKRKRNNNKWVCMWVLHAIVLICTGVPKKPTWRDHPFLKRQAALQLWPGTTSLIQRDCTSPRPRSRSLTCVGGRRWGGTPSFLPTPSRFIASVVKWDIPCV